MTTVHQEFRTHFLVIFEDILLKFFIDYQLMQAMSQALGKTCTKIEEWTQFSASGTTNQSTICLPVMLPKQSQGHQPLKEFSLKKKFHSI